MSACRSSSDGSASCVTHRLQGPASLHFGAVAGEATSGARPRAWTVTTPSRLVHPCAALANRAARRASFWFDLFGRARRQLLRKELQRLLRLRRLLAAEIDAVAGEE